MAQTRIPKSGDTLILPSGRVTIHLVAEGVVDISADRNVSPIPLTDIVPAPSGEPNTWVFSPQ